MIPNISDAELVDACRILFSPYENICSVSFVKKLDLPALKKAYRRKALETHPDRWWSAGGDTYEESEKFLRVQTAYEVLKPVTGNNGDPFICFTGKTRPERGFYKGPVPFKKLLLGQFLYYTGAISWKRLHDALSWQREKRPMYGEIAEKWGMLSAENLRMILKKRLPGEKIGECAIRLGSLSRFQHLAVMGKQRAESPRFGDYFIVNGLYSARQMDSAVEKMKLHNESVGNNDKQRHFSGHKKD